MPEYKAILIDDERLARDRLKKLLAKHQDDVEIIGEASDGEEGLAIIQDLKPKLIFLDIQMPVMDGFEMLQHLVNPPLIIFTTAFDQYAIKAFEENSIDYLLKPIGEERLYQSIQKLKNLDTDTSSKELQKLLEKLKKPELKTITVSLGDRMILVPVKDIVYFHAEDKYVVIYDTLGKKHLISSSLTDLENKLDDSFIRVHRAYIINRDYVKEIRKGSNGTLNFVMKGQEETQINSSQTYTPIIRKRFL